MVHENRLLESIAIVLTRWVAVVERTCAHLFVEIDDAAPAIGFLLEVPTASARWLGAP